MSSGSSKESPGLAVSSSLHEMQELMSGDYLEADESSDSSSEHNTTQESLISISLNGSDQNLSRHRSNSGKCHLSEFFFDCKPKVFEAKLLTG